MDTKAVFFDLDDTLYPYPPCNEAGKRSALRKTRELGYDFDRESFESLYQEGRHEVKRELAGTASAHERFLYFKRVIEIHTGTHKARHALELGEAYWNAYIEEMDLFDGVVDAFETLSEAGISVVIVSNLTTRIQLKKIEHLDIDEYVDLVVTSEETGREKPSSIMFTLPLSQLDLRPSEAAMVGNSVTADIEGANAAGLTTVLFNNDTTELTSRQAPDHHVDDFRDVVGVVG